ncbi:hypothetical protein IMZ48_40855 [Candidatus Bathyarchaeota archaeon]|nr:hypothetical protein [Candidatus Bathyarchaeota archaeon]
MPIVLQEIEKDNAIRDSRRSQKPKPSEDTNTKTEAAATPEAAPPAAPPAAKPSSSAFY